MSVNNLAKRFIEEMTAFGGLIFYLAFSAWFLLNGEYNGFLFLILALYGWWIRKSQSKSS